MPVGLPMNHADFIRSPGSVRPAATACGDAASGCPTVRQPTPSRAVDTCWATPASRTCTVSRRSKPGTFLPSWVIEVTAYGSVCRPPLAKVV